MIIWLPSDTLSSGKVFDTANGVRKVDKTAASIKHVFLTELLNEVK